MTATPAAMPRVVIVDDDFLILAYLEEVAQQLGCDVVGTAATVEEAVAVCDAVRPDVALMDVRLGSGEDGITAAETIRTTLGTEVIFITGSTEEQTMARMRALAPRAILAKPILPEQLARALRPPSAPAAR